MKDLWLHTNESRKVSKIQNIWYHNQYEEDGELRLEYFMDRPLSGSTMHLYVGYDPRDRTWYWHIAKDAWTTVEVHSMWLGQYHKTVPMALTACQFWYQTFMEG